MFRIRQLSPLKKEKKGKVFMSSSSKKIKRTQKHSKKKNGALYRFFQKVKDKLDQSPAVQKLLQIGFVKKILQKLSEIFAAERLKKNLRQAFLLERTICRLIASWCFFVVSTLGEKDAFTNLEWLQETELSAVAGATLGFFVLFSLIAVLVGKINTDALVLLPGSTACIFHWCFFAPSTNREWFMISAILIYALFLIYCIRALANVWEYVKMHTPVAIALASIAGIVCFGGIAMIGYFRYKSFASPNFDFGIWANMFYNMKETGLAMVTCERDQLLSHFAVHISPVYYLLLPFYYVFSSPITLQIAQAVVLAAGVVPVFLLARHFKFSNPQTVVVCILYAFLPVITTGCSFDFHENCFLPLFLLFTFYFYEIKKPIPMYVCALLVLSVKEDAAIYLLLFALFLLLSERKYLHGSILAVMAIGYFLLCGHILETTGMGMMSNRYNNLMFDTEDGLAGAIKTILVNPGYILTQLFADKDAKWDKVMYVIYMILPLGMLPFASKKSSRWLLVAPMLINLLTMYTYQPRIGYQYHFGIAAFLVYAMLKNLPDIESPDVSRTLLSLAAAACLCSYLITAVPLVQPRIEKWKTDKDKFEQMEVFLEENVPDDVSVAASTYLLPHIADRSVIYEVHYHKNKPDVEYVVLDTRYSSYKPFYEAYIEHGYTAVAQLDTRIMILQQPTK